MYKDFDQVYFIMSIAPRTAHKRSKLQCTRLQTNNGHLRDSGLGLKALKGQATQRETKTHALCSLPPLRLPTDRFK